MYPGLHAQARADQPAIIMAGSGETVTYRELEARSNRLAHLLRARGLKRLDHYSIYMENNARYVECCTVGERAGLYYTCVNSFLTVEELAYILNNSQSKVLITSQAKRDVALAALPLCPKVELCLVVDGPGEDGGRGDKVLNLEQATAGPFHSSSAGMAIPADLPDWGGPNATSACRCSAYRSLPPRRPRARRPLRRGRARRRNDRSSPERAHRAPPPFMRTTAPRLPLVEF